MTSTALRADTSTPVLHLEGISKAYPGVQALDQVTFDVHRGSIHALLGENGAGKSTLMNILFGFARADAGHIELAGAELELNGPRDAIQHRIGMVHQHFMLVPDMTVVENVALQSARLKAPRLNLDQLAETIRTLSTTYGLAVDPHARIDQLSVGEQQRVELLKVLAVDSDIIVLDEPTAVLTSVEWQQFREVLRQLAADGRTIIFITHKLDEVIGLADRATILRGGKVVENVERANFERQELARAMVGRSVDLSEHRISQEPGDLRLQCSSLTVLNASDGRRGIENIDLSVRAGEIVAIAGVDGNGQTELVDAIVGLATIKSGSVVLAGEDMNVADPERFRVLRGAYIPGDRARRGMAGELSVFDNALLNHGLRAAHSRRGILDLAAARKHVTDLASQYDVRMASLDTRMSLLSGGNQQKVVLARELHDQPMLLIAAQPTRGLDVGACEYVYDELRRYRDAGGAVLLVSTELEEVLNISTRTHVIVDGTLSPSMNTADLTLDQLGLLLGGGHFGSDQ